MTWILLVRSTLRMNSCGISRHLQHQRDCTVSLKLGAKIETSHRASFKASDVVQSGIDIHLSNRFSVTALLCKSFVSPGILLEPSVDNLVFALHPLRPPRDPSTATFSHN